MSNTLNSFGLSLSTETALSTYTATFTDVDNITVNSQDLTSTSIGSFKIIYGTIDLTFTQDNQALGSHRIVLPDRFFSTAPSSVQLTMSNSTAYQITAHCDGVDDDFIDIYYSQGIAPGSTTSTATVNIFIWGV